jgi:demethylmenaquinone methyltransferase/2-methoxy-6-polyprenyl-1,4-benzoquinol methylase
MPKSSPDPRVGFFDRIARRWDAEQYDPLDTVRRIAEHADRLGIGKGERVLEVGCGTGQLTGWLKGQADSGEVVAMDFSPEMLRVARGKGIDARFVEGDVCAAPPGGGGFDLVLCFHSFPHFRDPARALEHLAGALAPGGRLIVMHFNSREAVNAFHDRVGEEVAGDHLPDEATWRDWLGAAGMAIDELIDRDGLYFLRAVRPGAATRPAVPAASFGRLPRGPGP